jgi:hypothetical protein
MGLPLLPVVINWSANIVQCFKNINPNSYRSYMVSPSLLESLGSSCLGLYHEHSPHSRMRRALLQSVTRSEPHRQAFSGNAGEDKINLDSLRLGQFRVNHHFIELVEL